MISLLKLFFYLNPNTAAFITLCGYILALHTTYKYKFLNFININENRNSKYCNGINKFKEKLIY